MPQGSIGSAVGRQPALNRTQDQQVVIDLLSRIEPANGGPVGALPPATRGVECDFRLVNAIFEFQREMVRRGRMQQRHADGRVDPGATTIRLMNEFAALGHRGGRGGLEIPVDPKPPGPTPPGPAPKGAGFLASLVAKLQPRPTNLSIKPGASISGGIKEFGATAGEMAIEDNRPPARPPETLRFGGLGLSLGPFPFGVEVSPSSLPSFGSQIHAGPRTVGNVLDVEDVLGLCLLVGVSGGTPTGLNATTVMFGIGRNRSLETLPQDLLTNAGSNVAINFLIDSFNTCRGFASTRGVFVGFSLGVSLIEGLLIRKGPNIRPDPSVNRIRPLLSRG